jgi:hypothetical protein
LWLVRASHRRGILRTVTALLLLPVVGLACGHSTLIRRDDPVLDDSQRRRAKAAAAVEALGAPPPERQLFMQSR